MADGKRPPALMLYDGDYKSMRHMFKNNLVGLVEMLDAMFLFKKTGEIPNFSDEDMAEYWNDVVQEWVEKDLQRYEKQQRGRIDGGYQKNYGITAEEYKQAQALLPGILFDQYIAEVKKCKREGTPYPTPAEYSKSCD